MINKANLGNCKMKKKKNKVKERKVNKIKKVNTYSIKTCIIRFHLD